MGSISDFLEKEFLDHMLKVGSYSPPATVYLALSTADPTDAGTGLAEPGDTYVRKAISFATASTRTITQDADVTFDQASASWGTISHWAIMTASTSGNMLAHGALNSSMPVGANDTPSVASGEVTISVNSGACSNYLAPLFLNWAFDAGSLSVPTNLYVALVETTEITDSDTGSTIDELDMTGYSRVNHNSWNAATGESPALSDNSGAIQFNSGSPLTGTGETVTSMAILDASSAGNLLFYSNTPNQAIADGNTVTIPSGGFDVTCA